jgi:hypothetical protein
MVPIFLGGLLSYAVERRSGVDRNDEQAVAKVHQKGTLFAAGLITGEALMGIAIAFPIVYSERLDVLNLPTSLQFGGWLGLLLLGVIAWLLYRVSVRDRTA